MSEWIDRIIDENNINIGHSWVDTSAADGKSPDFVIFESKKSKKVLCVIEAKRPQYDIHDEENLKEPARRKASYRGAKYFAVTNFQDLILFDTYRVNSNAEWQDQIVECYELSNIYDINKIDQRIYKESIQKGLLKFLTSLYKLHTGKEPVPKLPPDEHWIDRLHRKVERLADHYFVIIENDIHKKPSFRKEIAKWMNEQGWQASFDERSINRIARQTAYFLVNKILFYMMLQAKRKGFDPLELPDGLTKGSRLQKELKAYFDDVMEVDYESIYSADFIDTIAFPDNMEIVEEIKTLIKALNRYNFGSLPYDIIGRIFERLIPEEERHQLGQFYTNPDVVDIILKFCHFHEDQTVLDPSCGTGTFLIRAYHHKKIMNDMKPHEEILMKLWGNDISKFASHLAMINLAIRDLSVDENYPNIIQKDFFDFKVGSDGWDPSSFKGLAKTLGNEKREITYPRYFDAIIGNPPYTRQEELKYISKQYRNSKENLITSSLLDVSGKRLAHLTKRAGIHAYFFVHGWKLLKEGGYFGFIVSNSWLDVDYGKGLQEFFLKHYRIIAIIESKVERWFADADVNTCIVILQKCKGEKDRNENFCRFVYLKKRLEELIPSADESWQEQKQRLDAVEALKRTILAHNEYYENDDLRIFPVKQADLWKEGFDEDEKKYTGAKWGKYIRAPKIFFTILEKGKGKLVPLKEVAKVRRGFTTGANEFFYLTEEEIKRKGIRRKYFQPILFTLKEIETYIVDRTKLKKRVFICHDDRKKLYNTKTFNYIKYGEKRKYHERPTCASRNPWYSLGRDWDYAPIIFPAKVGERMPIVLNDEVFEDKKFYGIIPKEKDNLICLAGLLNSTLSRFFIEFTCRQLTGAQAIADIDVVIVESLPIISPLKISSGIKDSIINAFNKLSITKAESLFKEIALESDALKLDTIKPSRRSLDKIVMGDILGLTEEEQLEVYRAVVDLVRSRLDKAKSVKGKKQEKDEVIELVSEDITGEIREGSEE